MFQKEFQSIGYFIKSLEIQNRFYLRPFWNFLLDVHNLFSNSPYFSPHPTRAELKRRKGFEDSITDRELFHQYFRKYTGGEISAEEYISSKKLWQKDTYIY